MAALELEQRLAELEACDSVANFEETFGALMVVSATERALPLSCGYQLVFECGHVSVPLSTANGVDWAQITKIKITAVGALHG